MVAGVSDSRGPRRGTGCCRAFIEPPPDRAIDIVVSERFDKGDEAVADDVLLRADFHCPNGSHLAIYDDQEAYVAGLIRFITDVVR